MAEPRPIVLINALGLIVGQQRGAEKAFTTLVRHLATILKGRVIVVTNRTSLAPLQRIVGVERVRALPITGHNRVGRLLCEIVMVPFMARWLRCAAVISSSAFPAVMKSCPTVIFIHDLLPFHFPDTFSRAETLLRKILLQLSVRTCSVVATVSQTVAKDLRKTFGQRTSVLVVPNASYESRCDATVNQNVLIRLGLRPGTYVLSVLGGKKYKNQAGLVAAFRQLTKEMPQLRLVIAGDANAVIEELGLGNEVIATGYIPDEELSALYRCAALFVFPSLFEGFGMPVIEAQRFGIPVICSDIPVLREVAGEGALFANTMRPVALSAAMRRVMSSTAVREDLIAKGLANAERFSWEASARVLADWCDRQFANRAGSP